jgi:hypothetical protein
MIALVETILTTATGRPVQRRLTWEAWKSAIAQDRPELLVLLPHTVLDPIGLAALEATTDPDPLLVSEVEPEYVVAGSPDHPTHPIVLLLGCQTAPGEVPFQEFPERFHRAGAPVVVGTLTKVLGRHAAPVAARLASELVRRSSGPPTTFGRLLRDLLRELLAAGLPMVLVLTAYGDADWVLGGDG